MRFQTFWRLTIPTGNVIELPFTKEHFNESGLTYVSAPGMPILEAYELINKWNRNEKAATWLYWLA